MLWWLFVTVVFAIGVNSNKFDVKIRSSPIEIPPFRNLTCSTLSGYLVSHFRSTTSKSPDFKASFQYKLRANEQDQSVYLNVTHWDRTYAPESDDYRFVLKNNEHETVCMVENDECKIDYSKNYHDEFRLRVGPNEEVEDNVLNILYYKPFHNRLILENAIGKCTNIAFNTQWNPEGNLDWTLIDGCVCCGEYDEPSSYLACPQNPWKWDNDDKNKVWK